MRHLLGIRDLDVDVIRALLAAGARRDYVSAGGFTAAQYAGMAQCSEISELLEK